MEQILSLMESLGYQVEGNDLTEQTVRGIVWYIENINNNVLTSNDEVMSRILSIAQEMNPTEALQLLPVVEWLVKEIRTKKNESSLSLPSLIHA
jgi:hypothetical protein